MEKISYKLPTFEGPLDLLLHLINKNKLNIYDISISELLSQYMEHLNLMQEADMDVASEFLEMASRLVEIKSAMLLPKYEEEGENLKRELTGQLLEYQECRRVAKILSEKISFDSYCREPIKMKCDMTYRRSHEPSILAAAYLMAAGRGKRNLPPSEESFSGIVKRKIVSVSSRIIGVLRLLHRNKTMAYDTVFMMSESKSELVATFLAILELVKGKRIRVEGEGELQQIRMIEGGARHGRTET